MMWPQVGGAEAGVSQPRVSALRPVCDYTVSLIGDARVKAQGSRRVR